MHDDGYYYYYDKAKAAALAYDHKKLFVAGIFRTNKINNVKIWLSMQHTTLDDVET